MYVCMYVCVCVARKHSLLSIFTTSCDMYVYVCVCVCMCISYIYVCVYVCV